MADDAGNVVTYAPGGWSPQKMIDTITSTGPNNTPAIEDVSCPTPSFCMAVDASGNAITGKH